MTQFKDEEAIDSYDIETLKEITRQFPENKVILFI